jgi:DNA-binding NarL/FixJ family response regulator
MRRAPECLTLDAVCSIVPALEFARFRDFERSGILNPLAILIVEDNPKLRSALKTGLEAAGETRIVFACDSGEAALEWLANREPQEPGESGKGSLFPDVLLLDVQLAGKMNGIQAATAARREFPRLPLVFYSIQDDDAYYRDFCRSGILSHYAYVRKSNYLLPEMLLPLLRDAASGRSFIDPEIEARVQEVRRRDENDPLALLEPSEQAVARMLAQGLTNEQIAARMGFRDKRTISRTNGQIYAAWGLAADATDEKVARTRVALIVAAGRLLAWDTDGTPKLQEDGTEWAPWKKE